MGLGVWGGHNQEKQV